MRVTEIGEARVQVTGDVGLELSQAVAEMHLPGLQSLTEHLV
jgi:hypothetical protein